MARRAASPAVSENEADIFDSIFDGSEQPLATDRRAKDQTELDVDDILNADEAGGDEGDEAYIALQQAASFRKAGNLKGRTVKKGGGFQAMGMILCL